MHSIHPLVVSGMRPDWAEDQLMERWELPVVVAVVGVVAKDLWNPVVRVVVEAVVGEEEDLLMIRIHS